MQNKHQYDRREFFNRSLAGMATLGFSHAAGKDGPLFNRSHIFSTLKPGLQSKKIGIIICGRYESCGGGKCLRSVKERVGGFARYPEEMPVDVVGFG